jgi:hypothetical protein
MVAAAAAQLGAGEVRMDASLHQESRWVTQAQAHLLLPWPTSRAAIDGIADAALSGGSAIVPMTMPQISDQLSVAIPPRVLDE